VEAAAVAAAARSDALVAELRRQLDVAHRRVAWRATRGTVGRWAGSGRPQHRTRPVPHRTEGAPGCLGPGLQDQRGGGGEWWLTSWTGSTPPWTDCAPAARTRLPGSAWCSEDCRPDRRGHPLAAGSHVMTPGIMPLKSLRSR
jgi:hypothetical protein